MSQRSATTQSSDVDSGASRRARLVAWVLLLSLIAFHLLNNWWWRATNEVVFGFDRMFHQVTSLAYYDILRQGIDLRTLFAALTWSDYYPPLVHLTAAGFYKLFGVSTDMAALSNSLYLVAFLLAVYGIGERLAGPWVGLLSAFIVSTFPILFSMSRYLYVDFALAAVVAVNICLLLRTERFQHKGYSLLYGLSLGLGMLVKWTFVVFVAAPLLVVLAAPGVVGAAWRALHPVTWDRRRLSIACLLGLGLTALWFVPNVEATAALPLGYALVPLSWLVWSLTGYFVLAPPALSAAEPSARGANLLAALGLGLGVASAWYLTKINFLGTFWLNAYGKPTGRSWAFAPYLDFLYREQLSPLYAALLLAAVVGLLWSRWRRARTLQAESNGTRSGRAWRAMLALGVEGWVLVLWAVVPYVVFSSRVSIVHSRYIMPLLPPLGIAIALWLGRLRPRWLRALLVGLVAVAALFQFSALTFDALAGVQERLPLLADGLSIQLPASGQTDPGYWAVPDVLQYVDDQRGTGPARLGVLVNKPQANSKHFIYLAYAGYPEVQIDELATIGWTRPAYPRLFESDFLLLIDPPPDYVRRPDTAATIERLLTTPDDTFHRAFVQAQAYPLPDDTRLILYQRRFPRAEVDPAYAEALATDLAQVARPGDAVVVMPPSLVYALGQYGDGSLPIYPLPSQPGPFSAADADALADLGAAYERLWVVLGDTRQRDPEGAMARWLAEHFYRAHDTWYGSLELVLYAPGMEEEGTGAFQASQAAWQNGIALEGYRFLDASLPLGGIVRLDLHWGAAAVDARYKVFLHLLDGEGQLVSQRDSEPVDGFRPTTGWAPGERIADRYGLWLSAASSGLSGQDLPPGEYRILLGWYHAERGERVPVCCPAADALPLATVHVEGDLAYILPP